MTLREEFLATKTYEEYDARRDEFRKLGTDDEEVMKHLDDLLGEAWAPEEFHQDVKIQEVKCDGE